MKCQICDGTGIEKVYDKRTNAYFHIPCATCHGTGELEEQKQTNFDQVTSSPEALAKFINKAERIFERCCNDSDVRCDFCECQWCGVAGRSELVEWLKQEVK